MLESICFQPVMKPALIGLLTLGLAVMAWLVQRRALAMVGRGRSLLALALRLAFIGGMALVLMRPMIDKPQARPAQRQVFSVLLDTSASMATEDVDGLSREAAAGQALDQAREALQRQLGAQAVVKCYAFSGQIQPAMYEDLARPAAPEGEQTDIGGALMAAAEAGGSNQAGMLLISDGRVNEAMGSVGTIQAARYLSAHKVPVWTATVGQESKARDVEITALLNQNFLYARQPGVIEVRIDQTGYPDWRATVRLKREGVEVASQQLQLGEMPSLASFPVTESVPGLYAYEVSVDPLPREAETENNRRTVYVRTVDQKTRVLLVEGEPYWDTKFLLRALGKDPNLEVTAIFQVNQKKMLAIRQGTPPTPEGLDPNPDPETVRLPRTRDELFQYDVVILGRGADRLWSAEEMKLFKDYLTGRGGNLIFARGAAYDDPAGAAAGELAALEPLVWGEGRVDDVRLELTEMGRQVDLLAGKVDNKENADTVIRELPTMLSVTRVRQEKSLAVVLARTVSGAAGEPIAALTWQRYGKGKVLSVGGAGLWRWELAPPPEERLQGVYDVFWRQLVQWMAAYSDFLPNQQVTFESSRATYGLRDQVRLTVRTREIDPKQYRPRLELIDTAGARTRLDLETEPDEPDVFSCAFIPQREGEFRAVLSGNLGEPKEATVRFTVYEESSERRRVAANAGLMRQIAHTTGGEAIELGQVHEIPERLNRLDPAMSPRNHQVDLWDRPVFFYLLAGLIGLEWLIRRLSGLA